MQGRNGRHVYILISCIDQVIRKTLGDGRRFGCLGRRNVFGNENCLFSFDEDDSVSLEGLKR